MTDDEQQARIDRIADIVALSAVFDPLVDTHSLTVDDLQRLAHEIITRELSGDGDEG